MIILLSQVSWRVNQCKHSGYRTGSSDTALPHTGKWAGPSDMLACDLCDRTKQPGSKMFTSITIHFRAAWNISFGCAHLTVLTLDLIFFWIYPSWNSGPVWDNLFCVVKYLLLLNKLVLKIDTWAQTVESVVSVVFMKCINSNRQNRFLKKIVHTMYLCEPGLSLHELNFKANVHLAVAWNSFCLCSKWTKLQPKVPLLSPHPSTIYMYPRWRHPKSPTWNLLQPPLHQYMVTIMMPYQASVLPLSRTILLGYLGIYHTGIYSRNPFKTWTEFSVNHHPSEGYRITFTQKQASPGSMVLLVGR